MPKPDCFVYLDLSPEEAMKRKQEEDLKTLQYRSSAYKAYYGKYKTTKMIDANKSINKLESEIQKIIFEVIAKGQRLNS